MYAANAISGASRLFHCVEPY